MYSSYADLTALLFASSKRDYFSQSKEVWYSLNCTLIPHPNIRIFFKLWNIWIFVFLFFSYSQSFEWFIFRKRKWKRAHSVRSDNWIFKNYVTSSYQKRCSFIKTKNATSYCKTNSFRNEFFTFFESMYFSKILKKLENFVDNRIF